MATQVAQKHRIPKLRIMMVMVSLMGFCGFAATQQARGSVAPPSSFIRAPWDDVLTFHTQTPARPLPPSRILWQHAGQSLSLNKQPTAAHLLTELPTAPMVMVSFALGNELADEFAADPETILYQAPSLTQLGRALLPLPDQDKLERWASAAHGNQAGLPCGKVEAITGLIANGTPKHYPPIWRDHINLPSVAALLDEVSASAITQTVTTISASPNRRHTTTEGSQTPAMIASLVEKATAGKLATLTVKEEPLSSFDTAQHNLVVRLPGVVDPETTVIVGAHMDTILRTTGTTTSPGADDDASGLAVILETLRILASHNARFARSLEFHAYAAEEVGLWGSKDLAQRYQRNSQKVAAMLQLDMVLYAADSNDLTIHLVATDTSSALRRSLKNLLNAYLGGNYLEKPLTEGTSDHKSWTDAGFPAVFPFENPSSYNQAIHTPNDTLERVQHANLAARFAKLVIAFVAHHAGISTGSGEHEQLATAYPLSTDLRLAIVPAANNLWDIAVATPSTLQKVEVCKVTPQLADFACQSPLVVLESARQEGNRAFFINATASAFALADGEALAVFAYDAKDTLLARRTVGLESR